MAIQVGSKKGLQSEINMTPMIDVLLVLIIIFMVITPLVPRGLEALIPQSNINEKQPQEPPQRAIVIQVLLGGVLKINQEEVNDRTLGPRLEEIFKTRAERVAFVKADNNLEFREVAKVIDIAKSANVDKVGLMTAEIKPRE